MTCQFDYKLKTDALVWSEESAGLSRHSLLGRLNLPNYVKDNVAHSATLMVLSGQLVRHFVKFRRKSPDGGNKDVAMAKKLSYCQNTCAIV